MLNPLKLLFFVVTAALEVTLLHFGTSLLALAFRSTPGLNWFVLLLTCLIAAWATSRLMPLADDEDRGIGRALASVFVLTVAYTVKIQAGGGWSPLGGWRVLWPLAEGSPNLFTLAGLLFVQLWCWWRGMALIDYDHGAVAGLLQIGVLGLALLTIVITPLTEVNLGTPPWGRLLGSESAAVVVFGLLSLALARIVVDEERRPENGWRWFRSSLASTAGIVLGGLVLLALVSDTATLVIRSALEATVVLVALVLSPVVNLLLQFWLWLVATYGRDPAAALPSPAPSAAAASYPAPPSELESQLIRALFTVFSVALYVVPLLLLLLAIILLRRQRRARSSLDGAVHESLWSRQQLASDLRGLLSGLRLPRAQGLRDALARLRSADPVGRIRRRYVQALLLGEAAGRGRRPPQTPLEYKADLADTLPAPGPAWQSLTDIYDQARYAPETIQPADAEAMDAAWAIIHAQSKENR